ncbi:hypothetical protein JCM10449v2_001519 [Rhodotorula kratochvilovae]
MAAPDTRTALAALASLSVLAASSYAVHRALHPPVPPAATEPVAPVDITPEKDAEKRYATKRERFSPTSLRWEDDDDTDSDSDDSDDDRDTAGSREDKGSEKKRKRRTLFTAKTRSWPKSPDYAGREDYIAISLHSSPLIQALRAVPALGACEDVFEDKPSIDARDLFLAREEITLYRKEREEEGRKLEGGGANEGDKEREEREKVVQPNGAAEADKPASDEPDAQVHPLVQPEQKTAADLAEEAEQLGVLLGYLDGLFAPTQAKLQRLLHPPAGAPAPPDWHPQISFPLLWALFKPEALAVAEHDTSGEKYALRVKSSSYTMTRDGLVFALSGQTLLWNGDKFVRQWVEERIPKFKGLRRLSALPLAPLDPSSPLHTDLASRGSQYVDLTGAASAAEGGHGTRFLEYGDVLIQVVGSGPDRRVVRTRAEGRAVVDVKGFRRMNPGRAAGTWWDDDDADDPFLFGDPSYPLHPPPGADSSPTRVSPGDLALLPPTVHGFSLVAREWGELLVARFRPIRFRDDAWERLVLEKETKELVKGLVECNEAVRRARGAGAKEKEGEEAARTDIIDGKGGGLIIALHGPPGTGKTLTAEAVAETLRVPLYTVGAGSLGVQADVLEKRLRDVLDVAEQWGATLLIDEADVFLSTRTLGDLQRNAMVSVFLRLLEHHQGVLILTTNSIRSIDEAFLSRFSIAITYPNLDRDKRKTIWRSFLSLAGVGIADSKSLPNGDGGAQHTSSIPAAYLSTLASNADLNGRQIKNAVRTASALARSQNRPLGREQLEVVLRAMESFKRDFEEADEKGVYEVPGEGWKDRTNIFN